MKYRAIHVWRFTLTFVSPLESKPSSWLRSSSMVLQTKFRFYKLSEIFDIRLHFRNHRRVKPRLLRFAKSDVSCRTPNLTLVWGEWLLVNVTLWTLAMIKLCSRRNMRRRSCSEKLKKSQHLCNYAVSRLIPRASGTGKPSELCNKAHLQQEQVQCIVSYTLFPAHLWISLSPPLLLSYRFVPTASISSGITGRFSRT